MQAQDVVSREKQLELMRKAIHDFLVNESMAVRPRMNEYVGNHIKWAYMILDGEGEKCCPELFSEVEDPKTAFIKPLYEISYMLHGTAQKVLSVRTFNELYNIIDELISKIKPLIEKVNNGLDTLSKKLDDVFNSYIEKYNDDKGLVKILEFSHAMLRSMFNNVPFGAISSKYVSAVEPKDLDYILSYLEKYMDEIDRLREF